jgi:hypothetical protein
LDVKEHDSEYEHKTVDLNLEQRVNNIICPLEVLNANDFAKDYIPLVLPKREGDKGQPCLTPMLQLISFNQP